MEGAEARVEDEMVLNSDSGRYTGARVYATMASKRCMEARGFSFKIFQPSVLDHAVLDIRYYEFGGANKGVLGFGPKRDLHQ